MSSYARTHITQFALLTLILSACAPEPAATVAAPRSSPAAVTAQSTSTQPSYMPFGEAALAVKQQAGSDVQLLMPVDPASGSPLAGYDPIDLGLNFYYGLAPDRKTLVVVSYPKGEAGQAFLRFLDLTSWTEATGLLIPTSGWTSAITISDDGSRLAFVTVERRQDSIWLVDISRHVLLKRVETPRRVAGMEFTADGRALMLYERQENYQTGLTEGPPLAELRSANNLEVLWFRELQEVRDGFERYAGETGQPHEPGTGTTYRPAVVFDGLTETMFILHADADRLTRVDFQRRETLTRDIAPKLTWLEHMLATGAITARAKAQDGIDRQAVISADGEIAYTVGLQSKFTRNSSGSWDLAQTHLPLRAIRLSDAAEVYTSEATADTLQLTSDGQSLLLVRWESTTGEASGTSIARAQDGEVLGKLAGDQLQVSRRMDGSPLLVASMTQDPAKGKSTLAAYAEDLQWIGSWQVPHYGDWIRLP